MAKTNDAFNRLVEEDAGAGAGSAEAQLMKIQSAIQRERTILWRWFWITAALWVGSFVFQVFMLNLTQHHPGDPPSPPHGIGGPIVGVVFVIIALSTLISTIGFFFRLVMHFIHQWGSGRREANLRLIMIEDRLRRMEEANTAK